MTAVRCSERNLDVYISRIVWVLKGRIYSVAKLDVDRALVFKMCLLSVFVATDKNFYFLLHACLPLTEILVKSRADGTRAPHLPSTHQQNFSYYL